MAGRLCLLALLLSLVTAAPPDMSCHCFPGDEWCWPTVQEWNAFNESVGGKLIATVPIGSVCHPDSIYTPYNAEACANLLSVWNDTATHYESSSSPMASWFANFSCDPRLPHTPCTMGPLVQYAVNASTVDDVQKTLKMAWDHDIRVVVRNTGHDYLGRSTGAGALAVWTHHMKDIQILDYEARWYNGSAIKVGAGVQIMEAMDAVHKEGLVPVVSNGQTLGYAGGFSQSGGSGQLASTYGLAADNVLEWELVTASGTYVMASPSTYSDLYWALSGGGGGTYGVVLSMTSKLHVENHTVSANLTFTTDNVSKNTFWDVASTFIKSSVSLTDMGGVAVWQVTDDMFMVVPATLPSGTEEQLQKVMRPTLDLLNSYNMSYTYNIVTYPSFYDSYRAMTPWSTVTDAQLGGRLIPRTVVDQTLTSFVDALRTITNHKSLVSGVSLNVSRIRIGVNDNINSVNPAWRKAQVNIAVGTPYKYTNFARDVAKANQVLMTRILLPLLQDLTPGGGAYSSEADLNEADWQRSFYGDNYNRLQSIKNRYDPYHMFYTLKGVGSTVWTERVDGRLCCVEDC
ncbi:FAD binding domain protein [Aspergillus ellipticus CBS 707.79]|uniref:FAD binding domain protein n=1 Tax=Aspergillus ellipticus CBS 707.79 TaxID=1448320 RepID=A0A319D0X8_9EURO|nr:FAD binding domain protein [Aspergillus ellipticus CBS 707.79]